MENNTEKALAELNKTQEVKTLDFTVNYDFVKHLPEIISNIDELKKGIKAQTEIDRTLTLVSEEDFEIAKKRCADLNKVKTQIETRRKDIKKDYIAPFTVFENKAKEVVEIIDNARDNLWGQITRAEEEKKKQIKTEYNDYYNHVAEDIFEYRTFEQIFNAKWLNKGCKKADVLKEIDDIVESVKAEVTAIFSLSSEFEPSLVDKYKQGASITEIISLNNRLKLQKQALESKKAVGVTNNTTEQEKTEIDGKEAPTNEIKHEEPIDEEIIQVDFRVYATAAQLKDLKEFLIRNKIKYGGIPKGE